MSALKGYDVECVLYSMTSERNILKNKYYDVMNPLYSRIDI